MIGESGSINTADISILNTIPSPTLQEDFSSSAESLLIDFENDQTSIKFTAPDRTFKKITFTQNQNHISYYSRQNITSLPVQYSDLADFDEGVVSTYIEIAKLNKEKPLELSSNFVMSDSPKFNAITHDFSEIEDTITLNDLPETISSLQDISFSGTYQTDIKTSAYIIKPNGFVDEIELQIDSKNDEFTFEYSPDTTGTYIVEIVDTEGLPVLNHPIYVGQYIPLIPDFFDLNKRNEFEKNLDLSNSRIELLDYINQSRQDHGLSNIVLSDELNSLAQAHSQDMADNSYFSHVNLDGETFEDRRINAGVKTTVSENIASDISVTFAHKGLMRSATHRENILNKNWTSVGIGLALNDEGYLLVTEEFSPSEVTQSDITSYKNELFSEINDSRNSQNLNLLTENPSLNSTSEDLNTAAITQEAELTEEIFNTALEEYGIMGTSQAIGRIHPIWTTILDSILEDEAILETNWSNIGIDIQIDSIGKINTILILNNN